jgi:hypothetical protein
MKDVFARSGLPVAVKVSREEADRQTPEEAAGLLVKQRTSLAGTLGGFERRQLGD